MRLCSEISKYRHAPQEEPDRWLMFLRRLEIQNVLNGIEENHFDTALELGCGSGKSSRYLARYCKNLVAIEYNRNLLIEQDDGKMKFLVGDAQDLSQFGDARFNLVFSSNLIEHLPELDRCLSECARVATDDGVIIHTVPNRTWKIFNLLLYHPFLFKTLLSRLFFKRESDETTASKVREPGSQIDSNLKPSTKRHLLRKLLSPVPHGISDTNWHEFRRWGKRHWIAIFEKNGFEIVRIVRQPFYFGYGYNFRLLLRAGNCLGLSACTSYILRKVRREPEDCT